MTHFFSLNLEINLPKIIASVKAAKTYSTINIAEAFILAVNKTLKIKIGNNTLKTI